jgi:hypothetical protein
MDYFNTLAWLIAEHNSPVNALKGVVVFTTLVGIKTIGSRSATLHSACEYMQCYIAMRLLALRSSDEHGLDGSYWII